MLILFRVTVMQRCPHFKVLEWRSSTDEKYCKFTDFQLCGEGGMVNW